MQQLLNEVGRSTDSIPPDEIERFCKNAAFLKAIRYRSLADEYGADVKSKMIENALGEPDTTMVWYVLLRAVDAFYASHKRYPGEGGVSNGTLRHSVV